MSQWFNTKIKYTKNTEDGKMLSVSEYYLFDAVSYTDAETRAYEFFPQNLQDFALEDIKKMKLNEVFFIEDGGEYWFKCRVQFITFDEKTKKEKKTAVPMLINALNVKTAYETLEKQLGNLEDYIISDINVTKIVEVIPYDGILEQKIADGRLTKIEEPAIEEDFETEPPGGDEEEVETSEKDENEPSAE